MSEKTDRFKSIMKDLASSYVVWAFIALFLVDGAARLTSISGAWPISPYQVANRSWIWWSTKGFVEQEQPADVVLMGSSLMMAAVHGGDAAYTNKSQEVALHNESRLLEDLLEKKTGSQISTYSFSLGGEMASDAYAITKALLSGEKRPKAIIYGVAPRDLMDNALSNPGATEVFRYMSRLGDLSDVAISARKSFWSITEYALTKVSFIYGHRSDFLYLQHDLTKRVLAKTLGFDEFDQVNTLFHIRKQCLTELPEDSGPHEVVVHPPKGDKEEFTDNLEEYRFRYASFKRKQFEEQLSYLERMLSLCKEQGIEVILVNMPLTKENVALMPPGLYKEYTASVAGLCSRYDAQILDMNTPEDFPKQYFADSVHLNPKGGKHFLELLSGELFENSRVASTMQKITH